MLGVSSNRAVTRGLLAWIATVVVVSIVAVAVHRGEPSQRTATAVPSTTSPPTSTHPTDVEATPTSALTTTTADTAPTGTPLPGDERTPTTDPNGAPTIGSALDIHPGTLEQRAPAPCVAPSTYASPPGLVVLDLAAGCLRVLVTRDEWPGDFASWSPDGTWLVTTIGGDATRIAADGSWREDLGGGGQVQSVALSPDGSRLAIVGQTPCCYLSEKRVLAVANADGTSVTEAEDDIGLVLQDPVWSRDSRYFAFVVRPTSGLHAPEVLRVVDASGQEIAETTLPDRGSTDGRTGEPTPASFLAPSWSADDVLMVPVFVDRPAYQSLAWFDAALHEVAGPTAPTALANTVSSSPDGLTAIYQAFDVDNGSYQTAVGRLDRATGDSQIIAHDQMEPALAPDGTRYAYATAAFVDGTPRPSVISVTDFAGHSQGLWTVSEPHCTCWLDRPPVWTYDGTKLAIPTKA